MTVVVPSSTAWPSRETRPLTAFDDLRIISVARLMLDNFPHVKVFWIMVGLKLAQEAEVEIKTGALHLKQTYAGVPLLFDIGAYSAADVVRITWPNGLIQNEVKQPANQSYTYREAQRLSGSCRVAVWRSILGRTWDNERR